MKRTTIMLPEDLKMRAIRRANMLGLSLGGFIRESLERSVNLRGDRQSIADPFFADSAVYQGDTPKDFSEIHDEYLYGDRT